MSAKRASFSLRGVPSPVELDAHGHGKGHPEPPIIIININCPEGSPAEYRWPRTWWTAFALPGHTRYRNRAGIGRPVPAFGVRSLSVTTGFDHTTVAALRDLRGRGGSVDRPDRERLRPGWRFVSAADPGRGRGPGHSHVVRAGKLPVLRPVFRELGRPAAFVYQALEYAKGPQRSFDLVGATGLSRRAVYEALETLAAWDLVERRDGRSARPNGSANRSWATCWRAGQTVGGYAAWSCRSVWVKSGYQRR